MSTKVMNVKVSIEDLTTMNYQQIKKSKADIVVKKGLEERLNTLEEMKTSADKITLFIYSQEKGIVRRQRTLGNDTQEKLAERTRILTDLRLTKRAIAIYMHYPNEGSTSLSCKPDVYMLEPLKKNPSEEQIKNIALSRDWI